jgi:hypothetical protein
MEAPNVRLVTLNAPLWPAVADCNWIVEPQRFSVVVDAQRDTVTVGPLVVKFAVEMGVEHVLPLEKNGVIVEKEGVGRPPVRRIATRNAFLFIVLCSLEDDP